MEIDFTREKALLTQSQMTWSKVIFIVSRDFFVKIIQIPYG